MKRGNPILAAATAAVITLTAAGGALAQGSGMGPGMGPGMMGRGEAPQGPGTGQMGPGWGMGPGMMQGWGGQGWGMGPGMMQGWGGGRGMMGPGMMQGWGGGPGMMGPGMMQGWGGGPGMMQGWGMGPGMMQGWAGQGYGPCGPGTQTDRAMSADDVRAMLDRRLSWRGNERLKVGDVKEENKDTIVADIVTRKENAVVERLRVDRHTGWMQRIN